MNEEEYYKEEIELDMERWNEEHKNLIKEVGNLLKENKKLKKETEEKIGRTTFEKDEGTDKEYRIYQITLMNECIVDAGEFKEGTNADLIKVALEFFKLRCNHCLFWIMEKERKEKVV